MWRGLGVSQRDSKGYHGCIRCYAGYSGEELRENRLICEATKRLILRIDLCEEVAAGTLKKTQYAKLYKTRRLLSICVLNQQSERYDYRN